ncbi:MAG: hypothetical protein HQM02_10075, partial [Magnetococcales bacterium]|nr:hypothetical protein [Magnetococcales bacterium]
AASNRPGTPNGQPLRQQLTLFADPTPPVVQALQAMDIDSLAPRQALEALYRLKKLL